MLVCILGRQPELGLAELEAVFGASAVRPFGREAALLDTPLSRVNHRTLGSVIKIAEIIESTPFIQWSAIVQQTLPTIEKQWDNISGKITFGLSSYDTKVSIRELNDFGYRLKNSFKNLGHPTRFVSGSNLVLNSAQVIHNNLDRGNNAEIIFVTDNRQTLVARTRSIQNVSSYSRRDFERPKRDARVGMLPPKLAQIMLNLAHPKSDTTVLDPFCGTGVVLMEAALQNRPVIGTDLNKRMVEYTAANLQWLAQSYKIEPTIKHLGQADATDHHWGDALETIVCETYLGRPLTALPNQQTLHDIISDCNTIIRKFLINLQPQLAPSARCCIAVPAWSIHNNFIHLPLVDDLENIGYNRVRFSHARSEGLIYHRPEQIVARELLVLIPRKD